MPGSAQVLAGDRRLGRFGLAATLVLWVLVVLAVLGMLVAREAMLAVFPNSFALGAVVLVLAFYAVLWVILTPRRAAARAIRAASRRSRAVSSAASRSPPSS